MSSGTLKLTVAMLGSFVEYFNNTNVAGNGNYARKIGWTKMRLNEFVRGKRGATTDAAPGLGEALGTSARLWMNLQSTWDLSQAERRRSAA